MQETDQDRAAADWLARRDSQDWTSEQQAHLSAWLEQSTANRVAFLRLEKVWSRADRLSALGHASASRLPGRTKLRWSLKKSVSRRVVAGGGAAIAASAVAIFVATLPSTASTGIGERRTIALTDGSSLELGPLSNVRYRIGSTQRLIWVDQGEAYLDVRHDAANPLIVFAGDRRIVDIGTRFSVRRNEADISVTVAEGRVEIGSIAAGNQDAVTIGQGSLAKARGNSAFSVSHNPAEVANRLSWRDGMLAFDSTTLDDVAAEFNRYNRQKLVIASRSIGAMRIGGRFRASHVDGFAAILRDAYGLKVTKTDQEITISE